MNEIFLFCYSTTKQMTSECLNLIALQYERSKDYDLMKKYYLMASEGGSTDAMNNLGGYYASFGNNYELMKTYYLIAIEGGNTNAMYNLGHYYHFAEKNYDEMKKYYLMAIEDGQPDAMNNLANYYETIENNYAEMKKYYQMAIDDGHTVAMNNLGHYYYTIEKNTELSKKYLLMAYQLPSAIHNLQVITKYNPGIFHKELKTKTITLNQLCLIYDNNTKLLEQLAIIYAKYEYPYVLELISELKQKIYGKTCIAECPICTETTECGHYPCDERHKVCRDCYWNSPTQCYYKCK